MARFNDRSKIADDKVFKKLKEYIRRFYEGTEHLEKKGRKVIVYRILINWLLQIQGENYEKI